MRWNRKSGQALIMVTLALFAMCGLMGLAVDFGWAFFVKRAAQRAADTAALAAAREALRSVGQGGVFACGTGLTCQAATACPANPATPPGSNVELACAYSKKNGFITNGNGNRQTVSVEANVPAAGCDTATPPTCVPNAPGVAAYYFVTVRVTETVPQLFSAVMGNPTALVAARATAAVTDSVVIGGLILLNRENETGLVGTGVNLAGQGGSNIAVPSGVVMSSQCNGTNCGQNYAGVLQGGQALTSPFTAIRGVGKACAGNLGCTSQSSWTAPPTNGKPLDDPMFNDPMAGKGQPPLSTIPGNQIGIQGGTISGGTAANPTILAPGNYYATSQNRQGDVIATGQPITLGSGHFQFGSCGTFSATDYVFFGGLRTGSGNTTVTFTPGRYVFAGQNRGAGEPLFEISNGTVLQDCTNGPGQNSDAGELFIFTDAHYPGLTPKVPTLVASIRNDLTFGVAGVKMGNNDNSRITLHGLNKSQVAENLEPFAPTLLWQDQRNSRVKYTAEGQIDITSCTGATIDSPCTNNPAVDPNREMSLTATPNVRLYGAAYQPRGAWLSLQAGGNYSGPLQVITGAVRLQGSPPLTLTGVSNPITRRVCALVE